MRYLPILLLLAACATPTTVLQNKAGHTVTCGGGTAGSVAGGMVGYSIQKDNDKQCVADYKAKGYKIIKHADEE